MTTSGRRGRGSLVRGARAVGAALVLAALVALALPLSVAGAATPPATRGPSITLLGQPSWAQQGGDVPFRLAVSGDVTGLEVRAVLHGYVTSRSAFDRSIDASRLGSVVGTAAAPASSLPPAPNGGRLLTVPLQDPAAARDPVRIRVPLPRGGRAGVYPIEIELRDPDTGERADGFVTYLTIVAPLADGPAVAQQLRVAWVWPLAANPGVLPSGEIDPAFTEQVTTGGRLARLADALPAGSTPITLAPGPETLATWARTRGDGAAAGIDAVREASRREQVLTSPYVPVDPPALEAAGLGTETSVELSTGADTLSTVLGDRVDGRTVAFDRLDEGSLTRLRDSGVDRLIVPDSAIQPPSGGVRLTPAQPFAIESGGRMVSAVRADSALAALLERVAPPALAAQRLLAGLAVVALEAPSQLRGVVVMQSRLWSPEGSTLQAVLAGLNGNPLLTPLSVDGIFDTVPAARERGRPVVEDLATVNPGRPPVSAAAFRATSARVAAFRAFASPDDAVIAAESHLLVSLSSVWTGATGRARARAELRAADEVVNGFLGAIRLPATRTLTLTSRDAEIPLSFQNGTGRTVKVRVALESDRLTFPNGSEQVLTLPPENTTVRFRVQSRSPGSFPVKLTVTSEDGGLVLQEARVTVRSSVVSGVGVFLTAGAALFLAVWWVTHWRRSRRAAPVPALSS